VNDPVSDREKVQEMAQARPGPDSLVAGAACSGRDFRFRLPRHFPGSRILAAFSFRACLILLPCGGSRVPRYGSCRLPQCWPPPAPPLCLRRAGGVIIRGRFSCSRLENGCYVSSAVSAGRHSGEPRLSACPADEHLRHAHPGARMFIVAAPSGTGALRLLSRTVAAGPLCSA
jgi:hypothetical protein